MDINITNQTEEWNRGRKKMATQGCWNEEANLLVHPFLLKASTTRERKRENERKNRGGKRTPMP